MSRPQPPAPQRPDDTLAVVVVVLLLMICAGLVGAVLGSWVDL